MKLLCFAGRRYSGKDHCSNLIMDMDMRFHKVAFSDIPRLEYSEIKGIDIDELTTPGIKEKHRAEFIEYCQGKKKEDQHYWANRYFDFVAGFDYVVCPDLRFIEELEMVIKNNGVVYKVYASPEARKQRGWKYDPKIDEHVSETEMDLSPYTFWSLTGGGGIHNNENTTEKDLRDQFSNVLRQHF